MLPFKTIIKIDRKSKVAIYLQIVNQMIPLINNGILKRETKLLGSRSFANLLGVHRKTIIASYDELEAQGWVQVIPAKGTFVHASLPIVHVSQFGHKESIQKQKDIANFKFNRKSNLNFIDINNCSNNLVINDGLPDHRLSPINEITSIYRSLLLRKKYRKLAYDSIYGNMELRNELVEYLNTTRGLSIEVDQILITRGSQMGIYLSSHLLLNSKRKVIIGETNYSSAIDTFKDTGATLVMVKVDDKGLVTDEIAAICKQDNIQAVYVTSHHHHPTTVSMTPDRRMQLLDLSRQFNFAILEDDYAYDFHYNNAPIMPLASHDLYGNVIYIGSFSKIISPAIRIGYLIASKDFVKEAAQFRRIIDRQGDPLMELTLANMIKEGGIQRYSKKSIKIYKERRDYFCKLLRSRLNEFIQFKIPEGGMAVWVVLNQKYCWDDVIHLSLKHGVEFGNWRRYDRNNLGHNGIRIGFASMDLEEIDKVINILEVVFLSLTMNES